MENQFILNADIHSWYRKSIQERNEKNNAVLDEKLFKWPRMVKRSQKKPLPGLAGFHVVFFHIPKTGGTTLDYITAKNYRIDYVYQVNGPALDSHVAGLFKNNNMFRTIMGHYELNEYFYQLFDRPKLAQFTMIREPISRVISYYDYLRSSENHPKYSIAKDLSLEEFIVHPDIDEMPNAQTHRIMGLLKQNQWKKDKRSKEKLLEDVKYQLEHRFSLFGLTELYDHFLVMAQKTLGWKDVFYKRMNESKVKSDKTKIPQATIDKIAEINSIDMALYQFAKDLFLERCQEIGVTDEKVQQFKKVNKQFATHLDWHIDND